MVIYFYGVPQYVAKNPNSNQSVCFYNMIPRNFTKLMKDNGYFNTERACMFEASKYAKTHLRETFIFRLESSEMYEPHTINNEESNSRNHICGIAYKYFLIGVFYYHRTVREPRGIEELFFKPVDQLIAMNTEYNMVIWDASKRFHEMIVNGLITDSNKFFTYGVNYDFLYPRKNDEAKTIDDIKVIDYDEDASIDFDEDFLIFDWAKEDTLSMFRRFEITKEEENNQCESQSQNSPNNEEKTEGQ